MHFSKYSLSLAVILLVHCSCYCKAGLYETYENTMRGYSSGDIESVFLKNGDYPLLRLQNDSVWRMQEKECKCKNGRCENVCADWKDGACRKIKKACVCYPEFGQYNDTSCIFCNCGKGFNCTIDLSSRGDVRKCVCPEGYYDYQGKCAPFCSASQPCQNGGTCQDGRCDCMRLTHGPFCERIVDCATECRPRLTVDCVYNQEKESYECLCKNRSLLFDYQEWVCKPCPCGEGTCSYERRYLKCNCKPGYKEYQKQCRKCDCGPDHGCEILSSGEKSCKCREGFFEREGTCWPCECGLQDAKCSLNEDGRKICICPEGYKDILGLCERNKGNCTCHLPTANCVETEEGFDCVCKDGYMREVTTNPNLEEPCSDIDQCFDGLKCPRSDNQICVSIPGSYMCQCQNGYQPVNENGDSRKISCKEYKSSWLPFGITLVVVFVFIGIGVGFVVFLKKRESSRLATGMEVRYSR